MDRRLLADGAWTQGRDLEQTRRSWKAIVNLEGRMRGLAH